MNKKLKANADYIKECQRKGIEQIYRNAVPYPDELRGIKNHAPVLEITGPLILIYEKPRVVSLSEYMTGSL